MIGSHRMRARVIAFADTFSRANQLDDRPLQSASEHPSHQCQHAGNEQACAADDPHPRVEVVALDAFELCTQPLRRPYESGAADAQFDDPQYLLAAERPFDAALLSGREGGHPRLGFAFLIERIARSIADRDGGDDGIGKKRGTQRLDGADIVADQRHFEAAHVSGKRLACFALESLVLGREPRTFAVLADGVDGLAILEIFEAEQNGSDAQSGSDCDRK